METEILRRLRTKSDYLLVSRMKFVDNLNGLRSISYFCWLVLTCSDFADTETPSGKER